MRIPEYILREESYPCQRKLNSNMALSVSMSDTVTANFELFKDKMGQIVKSSEEF